MINPLELPTAGKSTAGWAWLQFFGMLLATGLPVAGIAIWFAVFRNKTKKQRRKRRQRHSRQHNPTRAEVGGLPPKRDPNQPPAGL